MKCRSGVVCRLCLSRRLSSGPPDDPSSCSFEGQYAPRGADTCTNDDNTDSSRQPLGAGPTKLATTSVTTKRGSVGPGPLSKPAVAANRRSTITEATLRRGGKTVSSPEPWINTERRRQNQSSQVGAWAPYCCESTGLFPGLPFFCFCFLFVCFFLPVSPCPEEPLSPHHKTRQDKKRQDRTGQGGAGRGGTRRDETRRPRQVPRLDTLNDRYT